MGESGATHESGGDARGGQITIGLEADEGGQPVQAAVGQQQAVQMEEGCEVMLVAAFAEEDAGLLVPIAGFDAHAPAIAVSVTGRWQVGGQIPGLLAAEFPDRQDGDGHPASRP